MAWTTQYTNNLPDSAFLFIGPGGEKDDEGKTTPRSLRHLPYRNENGDIDAEHLRNALARLDQVDAKGLTSAKKDQIRKKAKRMLTAWNERNASLLDTGTHAFATISQDDVAGAPRKKYKKDVLRVGRYIHPVHGWTMDVTPERLDQFAAAFDRMSSAGIRVEMTKDHSKSADSVIGYVVGLSREGDTLYADVEVRGQSNIEMAETVDTVSIEVPGGHYIGSDGTDYGEAITAVSLVQHPVVEGQEAFVEIAASHDGGIDNDIYIRTVDSVNISQETNMTAEELIQGIREKLGAGDDLTEENLLSRIGELLDSHKQEMAKRDKQINELSAQVKTLQEKAASKDNDVQVDPDVLDERKDMTEERIDRLVEMGRITPVVAKELKPILCGDDKPNAFMLSRRVSGTSQSMAKSIIAALEENDPVKLHEQTQSQGIRLSREVPDAKQSEPDKQFAAERAKRVASAAGVDVDD